MTRELPMKVPAETLNAINPGPYRFPDVHAYQISFRSDPELVASLVPEPLVANKSGAVTIVVAQYHGGVVTPTETLPGYNELVISVPSKYRGADGKELKGGYMVQLYLADREPQSGCDPTLLGLMIPGYPKRICAFQEFVRGETRRLRFARRGEDVLGLRITDAPLAPVSLPAMRGHSFVLKYVPSGSEDRCADVLKLNLIHGSTQMTSMAKIDVAFDGDAIRLDTGLVIPVREVGLASRCRMDMAPIATTELIDFLTDGSRPS